MPELPKLGERGGGWLVIQFALMAAIVGCGVVGPGWPAAYRWWLTAVGVLLLLAGAAVAVSAGRAHRDGLTPFPLPASGATLIEDGPYRAVRHPIYSGGILSFVGVAFVLSPWAFIPTGFLAVVWALKARVEERFLRIAYPRYAAYCRRTRFRLVPFVY